MPDHVHLLIRKHRDLAEEMIEKIQALSRKRLIELGLRQADHPVWTRGGGRFSWIIPRKYGERFAISSAIRYKCGFHRSNGRLSTRMTTGLCMQGIRRTRRTFAP
jgi:hypothetical protein